MKLDRDGTEDRTDASIILQKIQALSRNSCLSDDCSTADVVVGNPTLNQTMFLQVDQVSDALGLGISSHLVSRLASARIELPELFKHQSLELSIQVHVRPPGPFRVEPKSYHGCAGHPQRLNHRQKKAGG